MPRVSKYNRLKKWLQEQASPEVTVTFPELEKILGFSLPPSAYKYDPWWANSSTGSHMRAWKDAGWVVDRIDRAARRVTFRRVKGEPVRALETKAKDAAPAKSQIPIVTTADTLPGEKGKRQATTSQKAESSETARSRAVQAPGSGKQASGHPHDRQTREVAAAATQGETVSITLPTDLVDVKRLPPQARRLLEVRARRNGRSLAQELSGMIAAAVEAERRLLLDELKRLRQSTERPGSFDLMALLGRRT